MAAEPRIQRTKADLRAALIEQVGLLNAYCKNFDSGNAKFAKPMATALRVLLHHHGNSKSVLQQLWLRSGRFYTVPPPISPTNLLSECNLLQIRLGESGAAYAPMLEFMLGFKHRKPFAEWWVQPVAKAQDKRTMSRMDIIRAVADTDGGSHIDPRFTQLTTALELVNFLGGWSILKVRKMPSLLPRNLLASGPLRTSCYFRSKNMRHGVLKNPIKVPRGV